MSIKGMASNPNLGKKMNEKGWHVTITDLDTNEILLDHDTDAIVGTVNNGDRIDGVWLTSCDDPTVVNMLLTTKIVTQRLKSDFLSYFREKGMEAIYSGYSLQLLKI